MEFGGRIGMDKEVSMLGDGSGGAPDGRDGGANFVCWR